MLGLAHGVAFLVKYRATEVLGSVLHWCGEGEPPGAGVGDGETLPRGLRACSLDGRWTLPSEKLQWLLVSTRRCKCFLSVSDIYQFISTYRH